MRFKNFLIKNRNYLKYKESIENDENKDSNYYANRQKLDGEQSDMRCNFNESLERQMNDSYQDSLVLFMLPHKSIKRRSYFWQKNRSNLKKQYPLKQQY